MNTTFAIVGTAGRKDDASRLSANHFKAMYECAKLLMTQLNETEYGIDTVVSGGAAWADHVAVKLFLNKEVPNLKLFFPCPFLAEARMYDEGSKYSMGKEAKYSIGQVANSLHAKFSRVVGFNSRNDILLAIQEGAETRVCNGFYARNALVAQSDIILAMTFGDKEWLKEGGTAHTMQTYLNRVKKYGFFDKSFHYDLNCGEVFLGARVRGDKLK